MTVPRAVLSAVQAALGAREGPSTAIRAAGPVGGGCINPSARLEGDDGEVYFLKWNDSAPPGMFEAEADGLRALAAPGALRVPEVLGWGEGTTREDPGWLLLEYVPRGAADRDYGVRLGEGLAHLHTSVTSHSSPESKRTAEGISFGWHRDNFIGSLPQGNREAETWAAFWRDTRLGPQLELARELGFFRGQEGRTLDRLLSRLEDILPPDGGQGPALLHGDLWSGNYYPDPSGAPVLIDPAVYRGEGEVDLAMMELFGSLPTGFLEAYEAVRPVPAEYGSFRRDLYQLYYLLVHVNLFGRSYVGGTLAAARRVLQAT
ncbi:MAG: fructosamine kinase family protein [Longimicrobiales bacterium]